MNPVRRAYLELHLAVLLFGFTAILGDLIQLTALMIVWWRVLITSLSLLLIIKVGKLFRTLPTRRLLQFMGIGVLVGLHWICFYGAIKLANPSIALVCMATTSFFTSLIEPIITRQPVKKYELLLGLIIIPGMVLVVNGTELSMVSGIWVGLAAAFLAALFAILNKLLINETDEKNITFIELSSAWLFLSVVIPIYSSQQTVGSIQFWPGLSDWFYLIILSLLCTTLAYILALRSLHHLSAFASNLTINLEPVYGIILAWILLDDSQELDTGFYWGGLLILLTVLTYPLLRRWIENKKRSKPPEL